MSSFSGEHYIWNPKLWHWNDRDDDLDEEIEQLGITGRADSAWSIGTRKSLPAGSRFFLIKLGTEPKGIIGSGLTSSEPYRGRHWNPEKAEDALYVNIVFDFLSRDILVPLKELGEPPFSSFKWTPQGSGVRIPERLAEKLEEIWQERTGAATPLSSVSRVSPGFPLPDGIMSRLLVNRYERNPLARRKCIEHYGSRCKVCDVDLGERFGEIAAGYIHVHHIVPVSSLGGKGYEVDPVKDLVPVCPTCHCVLHLRVPPLPVPEARALLKAHS